MPAIEQMELDQKAVLWSVSTKVDNYGQNKVEDPIEINVRWENKSSSNRSSENQVTGIVAMISADREISVNSVMWKGELSDFVGSVAQNQQLCEVQNSGNVKDIKGRETRYEASLVRYKGTVPILEPGTGS